MGGGELIVHCESHTVPVVTRLLAKPQRRGLVQLLAEIEVYIGVDFGSWE